MLKTYFRRSIATIRLPLLLTLSLGSLLSLPAGAEVDWPPLLNGDHRSIENQQRDGYRNPAKTLSFFGVEPCDTVVELWPGPLGWYTEILAPLLKDCGRLYTAQFDPDHEIGFYRNARQRFEAKLSDRPDIYSRVTVTTLSPPGQTDIAPSGSADAVLTFRNIHNWLKREQLDAVLTAAHRALKPGGVLGVVEHRADSLFNLEEMIDSGYVSEALLIERAKTAGFRLLAKSEINANPHDFRRHPKGVWTLPPTLRLGEQDRERYLAIGESDRMTLKFIKR